MAKSLATNVFKKKFSSFNEGLNDMINQSEVIKEIFGEKFEGTVVDAEVAAINYIKNNIPDLFNKKNIHDSLTIGSNKVSIKTGKFIAFGWFIEYTYDKGSDSLREVSYEFTITLFGINELAGNLGDRGWTLVQ